MNLSYHWSWDLKSSPEQLWPWISNTDRFSFDIGLPAMERTSGNSRARIYEARAAGLVMQWEEHPFEWVAPHYFSLERRFIKGSIRRMIVACRLEPRHGGSHVTYTCDIETDRFPGRLLFPLQNRWISRPKFDRVFHRYDALAAAPDMARERPSTRRETELKPDTLTSIRNALARHGSLTDRFLLWVETSDELTLSRIRPYVLADLWGVSKRTLLDFFLHAAAAGFLDFQWEILCPHCRNAEVKPDSLSGISEAGYCHSCDINFQVNFDQLVELTFRPSPALRKVTPRIFCVGSPQRTPHIVAQGQVAPGQCKQIQVRLREQLYRLRFRGMAREQHLRVDSEGAKTVRCILENGTLKVDGEQVVLAEMDLLIENRDDTSHSFHLESLQWKGDAVTAAEVIRMPRFREWFEAQVLQPGVNMSVGRHVLIFTDIRESTRFYEEQGDARAFTEVMHHFDVLREVIESKDGVLVKTIGDAVMAVFAEPAAALEALLVAQRALQESGRGRHRFLLKAGMHAGPCVAVNANGRLDYFGGTVNIASRLSHLSSGSDVIMAADLHEDPGLKVFLHAWREKLSFSPFEAPLKGFEGRTFALSRVCWKT